MKTSLYTLLLISLVGVANAQSSETFHDFSVVTILGDTVSLSAYAGKKVLVVNTASFCAFTPQFGDLEALDSTYESYNFEVIGFPCNDFGGQDPYSDSTILEFCTGTYGVTFQMMHRISIISADTAEVYKWLQLESRNGVADANVTWNFHKFCIDEYGHWVQHFDSHVDPFDSEITDWITSVTPTSVTALDQSSIGIKNNPATDFFAVQTGNSKTTQGCLLLYSMQGVLIDRIYCGTLVPQTEYRYDVDGLPSGLYLVKMIGMNEEMTTRVCIAK